MREDAESRDRIAWRAGLAALGLLTLALYAPVLDAPFYYDDYQNIVENPRLRAEPGPRSLLDAALRSPTLRPIANLSFFLGHRLGGGEVRAHRLLNVGIHAANAVAVALLAQLLLARLPRPPERRARLGMAGLAGLLFAVHPLQIQSVTYVVQRMNSLAALFVLLALLAWLRGRESRRRGLWWSGAAGAWLLALGSKEIAVALPAAVWLLEWIVLRRLDPAFARRSLPWIGLALLAAVAGFAWAHFQEGAYAGRDFSFGQRLWTELRVGVFYAGLVLWPHPSRLNLLHEFPLSQSLWDPPSTLAAGLLWVAWIGLAAALARRAPLAGFALAWFPLWLALESFGLPLALVYEHRTYLPLVGVALALPWALHAAWGGRTGPALACGLAAAALLAAATWTRHEVWRDEVRFWSDTARKSPGVAAARNNLGLALQRAGRLEEALPEYRAAVELDPDDAQARFNLGRALALSGRADAAEPHVERALALAPWNPAFWNGLGALRETQGRLDESAAAFERALQLDPGHAPALHNLERLRARLPAR